MTRIVAFIFQLRVLTRHQESSADDFYDDEWDEMFEGVSSETVPKQTAQSNAERMTPSNKVCIHLSPSRSLLRGYPNRRKLRLRLTPTPSKNTVCVVNEE